MTVERKRILVVDDDTGSLAVMEELLEDKYEIKTVLTGREALDVVLDFQPALVLLDIMMPGIDGYEVCRQLRKIPSMVHTRIVFVSAKTMQSERFAGYEVGADDYVTKPFDTDELLAKIDIYLRIKSA